MKKLLVALAVLALLAYGLFEARRLIGGPHITIDAPLDGSATSSTIVTISGMAQNISFLTINDAPAFTDESGRFVERLSPPPGYAIFTVQASDRFGRRASAQVHITVLNYCTESVE
jgi:hypothetical protein